MIFTSYMLHSGLSNWDTNVISTPPPCFTWYDSKDNAWRDSDALHSMPIIKSVGEWFKWFEAQTHSQLIS